MHPALSEVRQTGTRFVKGPALATVIGTMSLSTRISQEILDKCWCVNVAGRVYGPYTGQQISDFVKEGRVAPHSIVRAGAEGPWITAIDDPFLVQFFVAETHRKQPVQAAATGAGVPVAATSQNLRRRASDLVEETNFVIVVDVRGGGAGPVPLEQSIHSMGHAYRVTQNAWILRSKRSAGMIRNELTPHLGGSDRLFVADTSNSKTAWFNLGPDADSRIRKVWAG
jgi:hypothetical protein